jgi:hypothetical protein
MNKKILAEYAKLKGVVAEAESRLEEIKPQIIEEMRQVDIDKVETDNGDFTIVPRSTWEYSQAVDDLKEREKANGTAKQKTTTTLMFKAK